MITVRDIEELSDQLARIRARAKRGSEGQASDSAIAAK